MVSIGALSVAEQTANEAATVLLRAAASGDRAAAASLLPLVYEELRRLARSRMRHLAPGQTIQPTALVHEAYLRLVRGEDPGWVSRGHFFAAAAQAMRNILVEHARRRGRVKRGGRAARLALDDSALLLGVDDPGSLLAIDEALTDLERLDERKARVVSLRVYAGLTGAQIGAALELSGRTVEREWRFARAWLRRRLAGGTEPGRRHA
jgi:RNA polymerase sigma factor (TIGR02999 family)